MNNSFIKISNRQALNKLIKWAESYLGDARASVNIYFDNVLSNHNGYIKYGKNGEYDEIIIKTPLSSSSLFNRYKQISDADFVKTGVTLFHELAHYAQNKSEDTAEEIRISDLSKYHNNNYYYSCWNNLPHEINAEYIGVMSMWNVLEDEYPNVADKLMLDYLSDRASANYMIQLPDEGFQTKEQVELFFEAAYETAVNGPRKLPPEFLHFEDEVPDLLTDEYHNMSSGYVLVANRLLSTNPGSITDKMMASLVAHLHPELQASYKQIDFKDLDPLAVFGHSLPETTEESRDRLGIGLDGHDSFSLNVALITNLENNTGNTL